jgi:hypothetical protein
METITSTVIFSVSLLFITNLLAVGKQPVTKYESLVKGNVANNVFGTAWEYSIKCVRVKKSVAKIIF